MQGSDLRFGNDYAGISSYEFVEVVLELIKKQVKVGDGLCWLVLDGMKAQDYMIISSICVHFKSPRIFE